MLKLRSAPVVSAPVGSGVGEGSVVGRHWARCSSPGDQLIYMVLDAATPLMVPSSTGVAPSLTKLMPKIYDGLAQSGHSPSARSSTDTEFTSSVGEMPFTSKMKWVSRVSGEPDTTKSEDCTPVTFAGSRGLVSTFNTRNLRSRVTLLPLTLNGELSVPSPYAETPRERDDWTKLGLGGGGGGAGVGAGVGGISIVTVPESSGTSYSA
mmetsp:Transcript_13548/g.24048  ORF Transcript_13548/g.24048 Transcript_13548/m.24048 type:complete len:208 (+) Transcript_13548:1144-1767(+)